MKSIVIFLLILIATTISLTIEIPRINQTTVWGLVIDENEKPIKSVKVEFYSQGSIVTVAYTDENGVFSTYINKGSYLLKFIKEGYEEKTINIDTNAGNSLYLGNITLSYSIKVHLLTESIKIKPGDAISLPFELENIGSYSERVNISLSLPKEWDGSINYGNVEVNRLMLDSGEKVPLTLIVQAPLELGNFTLTIKIVSYSGFSINKTIEVLSSIENEEVISSNSIYKEAQPGDEVKYSIEIKNSLNRDLPFNLTVNGPQRLVYSLKYNGEEVSAINLAKNGIAYLELDVFVPSNIPIGDYDLTLNAFNSIINGTLHLKLRVRYGKSVIIVKTNSPSLNVYSGSSISFPLKISNIGDRGSTISFNISGLPGDFRYVFEDQHKNIISGIYLDSSETEEIYLVVTSPYNCKPELIPFNFTVYSKDSSYILPLRINVLGKYKIDYITDNFYVESYIGETTNFTLTIKNDGHNELTNIVVLLDKVPTDMNVTVTPESIQELKPGNTASFILSIQSDPSMSSGDYYILFRVSSDETQTTEIALHVFLKQGEESIYIGIAILIGVIIALVLIYRKYGRR